MNIEVKKDLFEGERCFIVGTGSSLDDVDLSLLKNEITIGINLILLKEDFIPNYLCVADTTVMENHYNTIFSEKMNDGYYVICNSCLVQVEGGCHNRQGSTCRGIQLDDKYKNVHQVSHFEKSGICCNHMNSDRTKLLKTDEYYIDDELKKITSYGGSTIDNLAIPLAVHLGFKKIYLLGCDGGWNHFYDDDQKSGKRDWINYKHVIKELDSYGVSLVNCDKTNVFKELKYEKYEDIFKLNINSIEKFASDKEWSFEGGALFVDRLSDRITGRIARSRHTDVTFVLYIIKELMGKKCKTVLDIGSLWGGSTITMMQSEYPSTFISVDLFDGYYNQYSGLREGFGPEDPVTGLRNTVDVVGENITKTNIHKHPCYLIKGNSSNKKVINRIKSLTDNSIDLLFIDGDHTKEGVLKDWNNYSEMVSKGGIVVFDDYWIEGMKGGWTDKEWMDVVGAYKEIKNGKDFNKNWKEIGLFGDKKIVERL